MMQPETTLIIGFIAGGMFGYAVGFLMSRMIYRDRSWPHS